MSTALVTGASGGIGSAVARTLAGEGHRVIIGYHSGRDTAERLAEELGGKAVSFDLSRPESLSASLEECGEVGILVNNGGSEHIGLFQDMTAPQLAALMNTDLLGAMELTRLLLPQMISRHSGVIVNIASVWGEVGASCEVAYSAAKAGIIGFTKALAKEVAPSGIRVNCVSPGFIDTRMNSQLNADEREALIGDIPLSRAGTPQEVADAVSFLCSEKSAYICGQTLRVDGAWI
ncbi:3-oxoacyl-[acyl-carrier protein] reductase [Ruminococcus sp. YE71]|uniref:elongation factor P 5-aminopentanone reductase n=1 Tax=unclassified Ruminococcus TaxID=2608920 RepID=UPI000888F8AB|nr:MULTISPECIES: SDR family oxidoreductase [unclassified Ruminococcus]SDA12340.1 3-oxoacyl-[acyl-carrier protein] reductase [Ruminococcus sp. YE78]SFW16775.1 3-oxoacyl-[acyl-carrier protein] reductase [Ruminococcus sp. YE71]